MERPTAEKRRACKWREYAAWGTCAAIAAAAPLAGRAIVIKTTACGTVDTRLVRSADAAAPAVADTRRPITKLVDKRLPWGFSLFVR